MCKCDERYKGESGKKAMVSLKERYEKAFKKDCVICIKIEGTYFFCEREEAIKYGYTIVSD